MALSHSPTLSRILNLCGSSVSLEPVKAVLLNCLNLFSLNLASCRALPRGMKRHYEGIELVELRSQYEDKPRKVKVEENPPESHHKHESYSGANHAASGSAETKPLNEMKSEPAPDSEPDLRLNEESEEEPEEERVKNEVDLDSDLDQDSHSDFTQTCRDFKPEFTHSDRAKDQDGAVNNIPHSNNTSREPQDEVDSYSEPNSPTPVYDERDRHKTEPSFLQDSLPHQTQPSDAPRLDDIEVMTPEDLQMVAEALANTPDADRIAAAAEAEAGMTPTGRSTPMAASAASSTPRSGTYSEAGTPGAPGTLSEAGTPGQSGTLSEAGTPGPSGTESCTPGGTPGTPGTATTSGTTPQQGADGDGELLALAQDVTYSLDNHLNFSFSELDCGATLQ